MKPLTLAAFGDSLTQGIGDERALGWVGRVSAQLAKRFAMTTYNLGVRGNTSLDLSRRVETEARARLDPQVHNIAIVCIGTNDAAMYGGKLRVPVGRSVQLVKRTLDQLSPYGHVLWIGPLPVVDDDLIFEPRPGEPFSFRRSVLLQFNDAFKELATQLQIPYLNMFEHEEALRAAFAETSDGLHPRAEGYEALAARIMEWPALLQATIKEKPERKRTLSLGSGS